MPINGIFFHKNLILRMSLLPHFKWLSPHVANGDKVGQHWSRISSNFYNLIWIWVRHQKLTKNTFRVLNSFYRIVSSLFGFEHFLRSWPYFFAVRSFFLQMSNNLSNICFYVWWCRRKCIGLLCAKIEFSCSHFHFVFCFCCCCCRWKYRFLLLKKLSKN